MGFPEEEDTAPEAGPPPEPAGKILPFPPRARPDWLTGPQDDVQAASDSADDDASEESRTPKRAEPRLTRPGVTPAVPGEPEGEEAETSAASAGSAGPEAEQVQPAAAAAQGPAVWAPAASSIPVLKMPLPAEPESAEDEEADADAEAEGPRGLPGGEEDRKVVAAPVPLEPLKEAWWLVALDALRSERRVQAAVGGALLFLVVLVWVLWPHGMDSTALSRVRRNPAQFDGRTILVRGRVGDDVFTVGSGWAFYLTQGRDTIVAFTRTRPPKPHQTVSVRGQVSTGFLDGMPRQALFEDPTAPKK